MFQETKNLSEICILLIIFISITFEIFKTDILHSKIFIENRKSCQKKKKN